MPQAGTSSVKVLRQIPMAIRNFTDIDWALDRYVWKTPVSLGRIEYRNPFQSVSGLFSLLGLRLYRGNNWLNNFISRRNRSKFCAWILCFQDSLDCDWSSRINGRFFIRTHALLCCNCIFTQWSHVGDDSQCSDLFNPMWNPLLKILERSRTHNDVSDWFVCLHAGSFLFRWWIS